METIREELIQHESNKIESIKARIADLDEYKIELEELYDELKLEFGKNGAVLIAKNCALLFPDYIHLLKVHFRSFQYS